MKVLAVAAGVLALVAMAVAFVGWRASRALHLSRQEVRSEHEIHFSVRPFSTSATVEFEVVSAPAVFLQAARFQDHFFVAGPAGLLEYDLNGAPLRQFAVGRDLPSSPVVAIASAVLADSREPELVVATAQEGLLAFNGRTFRQIYPHESDARAVTTILPLATGHLLIGTRRRGVLLYDGKQIVALHSTLNSQYITSLAGTESDLWVGTLSQGVLHWHSGATESFGEEQGLPDRQVQSILSAGEKTYVGTVMGVAVFDRGRFSHVLAPGVLATALLSTRTNLLVGSEDQGVITIPLEGRRIAPPFGGSSALSEVRQFIQSGEDVYVLTRNALHRMNARGLGWQKVLQPGTAVLSDRNVSALAADRSGRLWVGYFDRGLDLLEADSGHATHVENEHIFCVNRILLDGKTGTVAVATANGLIRFDASVTQEQVLTRADGLIADHVTDVAVYRDGLAVATPAGLTFLNSGGARSLYAFHGLVNNHVYALGVSGDELMVGTLGGLSVIGEDTVRLNYTTATSGLKHNWITAVVPVGEEWMIGTYGAGILGLDRAGRFHSYEKASAPFEVNPNAMLVTSHHVFAGTLGKGLYVYDRERERWAEIRDGLPSSNVTALAESNGTLYVGTDNGLVRIQEQKLNP
ncbi:MAG: two-component regulator propeller domain-containing protein [Terriglobia bacterium]